MHAPEVLGVMLRDLGRIKKVFWSRKPIHGFISTNRIILLHCQCWNRFQVGFTLEFQHSSVSPSKCRYRCPGDVWQVALEILQRLQDIWTSGLRITPQQLGPWVETGEGPCCGQNDWHRTICWPLVDHPSLGVLNYDPSCKNHTPLSTYIVYLDIYLSIYLSIYIYIYRCKCIYIVYMYRYLYVNNYNIHIYHIYISINLSIVLSIYL